MRITEGQLREIVRGIVKEALVGEELVGQITLSSTYPQPGEEYSDGTLLVVPSEMAPEGIEEGDSVSIEEFAAAFPGVDPSQIVEPWYSMQAEGISPDIAVYKTPGGWRVDATGAA